MLSSSDSPLLSLSTTPPSTPDPPPRLPMSAALQTPAPSGIDATSVRTLPALIELVEASYRHPTPLNLRMIMGPESDQGVDNQRSLIRDLGDYLKAHDVTGRKMNAQALGRPGADRTLHLVLKAEAHIPETLSTVGCSRSSESSDPTQSSVPTQSALILADAASSSAAASSFSPSDAAAVPVTVPVDNLRPRPRSTKRYSAMAEEERSSRPRTEGAAAASGSSTDAALASSSESPRRPRSISVAQWAVKRVVAWRPRDSSRKTQQGAAQGKLEYMEFQVEWEADNSLSWITVNNFAGGKSSPMLREFLKTENAAIARAKPQSRAANKPSAYKRLPDPEDDLPLSVVAQLTRQLQETRDRLDDLEDNLSLDQVARLYTR